MNYNYLLDKLSEKSNNIIKPAEFVDEYKSHMAVMGNESFAAGLLFPAIPVWIEKNIGVDIVKQYLAEINH